MLSSSEQAYAQLPSGSVGVDVAPVPPAPGFGGAPGGDESSISYRASTAFRVLPEICCALSFPWWMAARVQARLVAAGSRSESPVLVAVVGALLLLPIYVLEGYAANDTAKATGTLVVPPAVWAFAALCLLAFGLEGRVDSVEAHLLRCTLRVQIDLSLCAQTLATARECVLWLSRARRRYL